MDERQEEEDKEGRTGQGGGRENRIEILLKIFISKGNFRLMWFILLLFLF